MVVPCVEHTFKQVFMIVPCLRNSVEVILNTIWSKLLTCGHEHEIGSWRHMEKCTRTKPYPCIKCLDP